MVGIRTLMCKAMKEYSDDFERDLRSLTVSKRKSDQNEDIEEVN